MFLEGIVVLILLYSVLFYFENFKSNKRAPGPLRFPPFGNLIQIVLEHHVAHIAMQRLAKKYGDVMSLKQGFMETVLFSSYEGVKHVFTKDESSSRECTGFLSDRNLNQNIGMIMANGPEWIESRTFCRNSLRNYGFGNRETMKNLILDELEEFFKHMESEAANPENRIFVTSDYFHRTFMNIVITLVLGKRLEYSDEGFQNILLLQNDFAKNGVLGAGLMLGFPFLRHLFPETLGYNLQMKGVRGFHDVARKQLRERKCMGTYQRDPTCFTDDFLREMETNSTTYTEDHFAALFADLLQAGTDTTSNVVNFILLHLLINPRIQEKVYDEIKTVVGCYRSPDIADKLLMPYTQATLMEGLRWSRVVVFGVPRLATEDIVYKDFHIKKGTSMMFNLHSIFFDDVFWGDPNVFRPERFFNKKGNLDAKKMEKIGIAFGAGKRNCFGEELGRDSMFIVVTKLIQKYKLTLPLGECPDVEPQVGISLYPQPYTAILSIRKE